MWLVTEGCVEATIHRTSYTLASGGTFMVPRGQSHLINDPLPSPPLIPGNNYSIKNTSSQHAKLFFCQARKVPVEPDEQHAHTNFPTFLPTQRFDGLSTSKASMLAVWLLQRLVDRLLTLRNTSLVWYNKNLAKYERFATRRRLCLFFFLLGLAIRRLPFIGSPPMINIQFVRVL